MRIPHTITSPNPDRLSLPADRVPCDAAPTARSAIRRREAGGLCSGIDGGNLQRPRRRELRPRIPPQPCPSHRRNGRSSPSRRSRFEPPPQASPSLPLPWSAPASDSGDPASGIDGSPVDAPGAASRAGSSSGPGDAPSSAAAEAGAASDQRPSLDSYRPRFSPLRNSTRIDDSLISRSSSVAARPTISGGVRPGRSRRALSTRRGTEPLGARLPPPVRRLGAAALGCLPRLARAGDAGPPAIPSSRRPARGRRPPLRSPRSAPRVFALHPLYHRP